MVYDQSLLIEFADTSAFLANFKYTIKQDIDPEQYSESTSYEDFDSHCNSTMVGFYRSATGQLHCASAVQILAANTTKVVDEDDQGAYIAPNQQR